MGAAAIKKPRELSWTPRRHGKFFCAPACGAGCTRADYLKAREVGRQLVNELGAGWKMQVWENLGWHCKAVRDGLQVYPEEGRYSAFIGTDDSGGTWVGHGPTPREAIHAALDVGRAIVRSYLRAHNFVRGTAVSL